MMPSALLSVQLNMMTMISRLTTYLANATGGMSASLSMLAMCCITDLKCKSYLIFFCSECKMHNEALTEHKKALELAKQQGQSIAKQDNLQVG